MYTYRCLFGPVTCIYSIRSPAQLQYSTMDSAYRHRVLYAGEMPANCSTSCIAAYTSPAPIYLYWGASGKSPCITEDLMYQCSYCLKYKLQ